MSDISKRTLSPLLPINSGTSKVSKTHTVMITIFLLTAPAMAQYKLLYDVVVYASSGSPIAFGNYLINIIPPSNVYSNFHWRFVDLCPQTVCNLVSIMLSPPEKFVYFNLASAKPVGPGALGFPNGTIPCTKYLVYHSGVKYEVCAYKHIIVYETHLNKNFEIDIAINPFVGDALKFLPWINDPSSPLVKIVLSVVMISTTILSFYVFIRRDEVTVV